MGTTGAVPSTHRVLSPQHSPSGLFPAGNCLFFGCRQKSKDFYCQAEWEELVAKGFLTLFTAFSRDQVSSQRGRVDTESSQAALMGLCQCFCPCTHWHGLRRAWWGGTMVTSVLAGIPPALQCHCPAGKWKGGWDRASKHWSR